MPPRSRSSSLVVPVLTFSSFISTSLSCSRFSISSVLTPCSRILSSSSFEERYFSFVLHRLSALLQLVLADLHFFPEPLDFLSPHHVPALHHLGVLEPLHYLLVGDRAGRGSEAQYVILLLYLHLGGGGR